MAESSKPEGAASTAGLVTLVIHGTYARREQWWRLGEGGDQTFADRLELALAKRGYAGTVWLPALRGSAARHGFAWSGENRHGDRKAAGRALSSALSGLAEARGATPARPLIVNLVAHSHGGNVVLAALEHLTRSIRIGRIVLLGTPLIAKRPSLGVLRFGLACVMAAMLLVFGLFFAYYAACLPLHALDAGSCEPIMSDPAGPPYLVLALLPLAVAFYGWSLRSLGWLGDTLWRLLVAPFWGMRLSKQAYGPSAADLRQRLDGRRIVLLSSDDDEAGVLLQLGTAPRHLYEAYVATRFGRLARVAEAVFVRSIVVGLLLRAAELVLERFVLGFGWLSVLFFDYEMADLKRGKEYPRDVLDHRDVGDRLSLSSLAIRPAQDSRLDHHPARPETAELLTRVSTASAAKTASQQRMDRRAAGLLGTLAEVRGFLLQQLKLRHSLYYASDTVLSLIADAIEDGLRAVAPLQSEPPPSEPARLQHDVPQPPP